MSRTTSGALPPPEIIGEYFQNGVDVCARMSGGSVNQTFSISPTNGERTILQQIGPMINPRTVEDYAVVADHLATRGWKMAMPILSRLGSLTVEDATGSHWRATTYIPSDGKHPPLNLATGIALGRFMGKLDHDLSDLNFVPQHSIPGLRDEAGYVAQLLDVIPGMPPNDADLSYSMIAALAEENPIGGNAQPIHNDPKLGNILFLHKEPRAIIDWDNLISAPALYDLGDMLRSLTGELRDADTDRFSPVTLLPTIEAYRRQFAPDESVGDFFERAIDATRVISLELAVRYMIDSVRGDYFQWDPDKYPDFVTQNQQKAFRQLNNYFALCW